MTDALLLICHTLLKLTDRVARLEASDDFRFAMDKQQLVFELRDLAAYAQSTLAKQIESDAERTHLRRASPFAFSISWHRKLNARGR